MLPILTAATAYAQEQSLRDTLSIPEAVVTTLKIERSAEDIPAGTCIVGAIDIKKHSSATVADVLKYEPGLSMGGDGIWATSINVRGLSENRLVTLIDRNRVETATDLTASLSMVDVNDIERVEVIKGAQSSIYGSGAIGGIVNIITKDGYFAGTPYVHGSAAASFNSANKGSSDYLSVTAGGSRWYVKLNGSYASAGDMMTPDGILSNSGFNSTGLAARAGVKITGNQTIRLQWQRNMSTDVGIPGGAAFSPAATATYKHIGRTLYNAKYEITDLSDNLKTLRLSAFLQQIERDVEMIPNAPQPISGAQPTKVTPYALHTTYGASAELTWKWGDSHTLVAGAEVWRRDMTSDRQKYIDQYVGGEVKQQMIRDEKPLPDASYTSSGIFAQDEMRFLQGRLIATIGARLDMNLARNDEVHNVESIFNVTADTANPNPPGQYVTFAAGSRSDASWSGNAGIIYKISPELDAVANASRSYRSPALEELYKFIDLSGNKIHFGNPDLKAESGLSADLGLRVHGDRFSLEISGFISHIDNMIVERKTNVDPTSVNDTLVLDNASRALLYGADFRGSYTVAKGLSVYASGAWTVGMETSMQGAWLPLIPPANCRAGIAYDNKKVAGFDFSAIFAGARKASEIADGETATQGYCRLDISAYSRIFSLGRCSLQIFGGIDNIINSRYVNFLSTNRGNIRCEPGRNFYIRANITF